MANVDLITWQNMDVTPVDDALVYETAIGAGGIIYGCEATIKNSNTLHINAGHAIICGRKMTVVEDDIAITLATAGVQKGRLYMQLDLSNTSTPAQLITEVSGALTPPIQDENVNIINGTYEINLYIFDVSPTEISNLVRVANPLGGILGNFAKIETRMVATHEYVKDDFLVKDNKLFKTLAAINPGELFEIGGNVKKTTVGEEIAAINKDLSNNHERLGALQIFHQANTRKAFSIPLTKSPRGFKSLMISNCYYDTGFPSFSSFVIPVSIAYNIGEYMIFPARDDNGAWSGSIQISSVTDESINGFSSSGATKIAGSYIAALGCK